MISPKLYIAVRGFLFIFLSFIAKNGFTQCNPPDQLPTITCEIAPLICLENACYETLSNPLNCCNGWCGPNTAIHNPEYFQFLATAENVQLLIHVDGCTTGNGLQSAILDACPWDNSNVVDCDPGTPPGGTMDLSGVLIPGNTYWLVIDGSSGATCDYTITETEGIYSPGLEGELMTAEAIPNSVCQGYNALVLTADPPVTGAHGYYWILEWIGDTITSTLNTTVVDVPVDVDPGTYEICVAAFSGCDTSDTEICFEVEFYEIPPEEKDPEIFCPEEFPFNWHTVVIGGEGEYEYTYEDSDGCRHDSTWIVESYPEPDEGLVDTVHCLPLGENTFYYEGEPYDQSGEYDLGPYQDINGCDSFAVLDLYLIGVDIIIELTCDNGEFVLTAHTQELIPFSADIEYRWYEQGSSTLLSEENPFLTLTPGCYDLWVNIIAAEGSCEYFIQTFCFNGADYYPPPPVLANADTLLCAQEGIFFYVIPDPDGEPFLQYEWSAPPDVNVFQDGSGTVEMDFSNSAGGQVCVFAIGECGPGPSTCFEVEMIDAPEAEFIVNPNPICINEMTTITFTGSASANPQVIWDFSTPTTITGSGFGPYVVSWATPGDKVISLTVIEPGCDTAFKTDIVTVDQLDVPVINCTSTISSITFDWNDVAGAAGYTVSFNGGTAVPINHSDTTLTGLTPGTDVTLLLTAVSGGACPNTTATIECTAEDCPPPTIDLIGQDSACLNNPTIIDLEAIVNGSPGDGTWAGTGIVDPVQGHFDPKVAGPGQHTLTYTVSLGGCPFNAPFMITVFDSITADFVLDPAICISDVANLQYTGNGSAPPLYDYAFDFGTATIEAGTGVGPYQLSWNTPGQKTVRLQVSANGCSSDIITHTTDVSAELVAPVVPCSPNTSGVVFSWTLDPASTGEVVNVLSGHTGTLSGNSYTFGGLAPGDTVEIEIISNSAGPCPSRRDTFECVARECPPIDLIVDPVGDICLYPGTQTVDLNVTVVNQNGGVGDWSGTGVTDVVNGTFDPVVAASGAHLVTYHYAEDGCDFYETITINVNDVPSAFISNTDLVITCTSGPIVLDGSGSSGTGLSYKWTTDGFIDGPADGPTANAAQPGSYQLLVSTAAGCKDSTSVDVEQDDAIPTADAGPDKVITCIESSFTIGGASTPGLTYSWVTTGGNITGATDAMTTTADRVGAYTITVRDAATGCESDDQMLITIDTALATIDLVAGDTIDCGTTISTASATLNEPLIDYTTDWTTVDGLIVNENGATLEVSQGGTYTFVITNKRNGCVTSEDVVIAESDEIIDAVTVQQKNITCFGDDDGELTITGVEGGGPTYEYLWSIGATATSLSALSPGVYSLTVSDQNGCTFETQHTITEPEKVTVDIGPNLTVQAQDSVRIDLLTNVPQSAIGTIDWGGYDGIFCPGCPSFQFIATSSATISATVSDTAGCTAYDSLRLTVIVPRIIFIPNIFSPNGDGINDFFTISGRFNLTMINVLRIYDRWGNQLFEEPDLTPGEQAEGWDGTFNDEPMQPGVYVFVADLLYEDGYVETVSGNITLVR